MNKWAHRVFILCAEGHLEVQGRRENKEESSARDGRDVVIPELTKVVMWWAPGRDDEAVGKA